MCAENNSETHDVSHTSPVPCSDLINWLEKNNLRIDQDFTFGNGWWRVYKPWAGGHYLEDRIKVLGEAKTLTEALSKAGFESQNTRI